jgi:hypothetical protein
MQQPRARIPVPAELLRASPPPRLVLLNASGWQADLTTARTVYVSPADRAPLRAHLRELALRPVLEILPAGVAAWTLLEALYGDAAALLEPTAGPEAARAATATLQPALA